MKSFFTAVCTCIALFSFCKVSAQSKASIALDYLKANMQNYQLTPSDIAEIKQGYEYTDAHNGVTHAYFLQQYKGIEVYNGEINVNIKNGKVLSLGNRFVSDIEAKAAITKATVTPISAVQLAMGNVNLTAKEPLVPLNDENQKSKDPNEVVFNKAGIALENISAKLFLLPSEDGKKVNLVWKVNIYELSAKNSWDIFVDAQSGKILDKKDNVISCSFEPHYPTDDPSEACMTSERQALASSPLVANDFNVLKYNVEGPTFAARTVINSPWNDASADASPFGWLNNGGNNYTYTRGNNVWAYKDVDNQNEVAKTQANSANSGGLDFNFPVNFNNEPATYQEAAITNLFYANNIMHDVWYRYGFNEVSRNFQNNNNGKGGAANDYVMAEAQDNANDPQVRNNANFYTPGDGSNPRMQMYLWNQNSAEVLINMPNNIAGIKQAAIANFGPVLDEIGITGDVVYALPNDGCLAFNSNDVKSKVTLIDRGGCDYVVKVKNAEDAGAIAVIIVNNKPGVINMNGNDNTITIPSLMISQADGDVIKQELANNVVVNATLKGSLSPELDGDFDNGIIDHEYGHGISKRLTGNNVSCLDNKEQGGEGWSDFFTLVMTQKPGDNAATPRPIGTYVINQMPNGAGIRTYPYSYDMNINPHTYGNVELNDGQVHYIGEIWCSALWDMYWLFVNQYGYSSDLYNGNAGNNIAMQLVIDGLKMQPCNPGFLDSRGAILAADMANNEGANVCLIWNAFARRGMGFSAVQGSADNISDQVEAFDLPPFCDNIVLPVNFISFAAAPKLESIHLKWKTTNEINNKGFDLQRKANANDDFKTIATIAAKNGQGTVNDYIYDDNEVLPNVRYYYRLAQKDMDNKVNYSKTVQAVIQRSGAFVQLYPNVVTNDAILHFNENISGSVTVVVTDVTGRVLYNKVTNGITGNTMKVDMSKYASGAYFIKVENNDRLETLRAIKK